MGRMMILLRLLLLVLSCYGYVRGLMRHFRVEFSLGVLFTSICATMFLAGILNLMKETAWAICLGGFWVGVCSFRWKDRVWDVLCIGTVFFVLSAVVLLVWLHGMILTDYDDFSHWGTVIKVMITRNRLPNFSDGIITYQSYPTGSAGFVYYFLTISGIHSEWFQLYVQALFGAGLLMSLFAFGRNWMGGLFTAACAAVLFLCNTGPINLLVDTLLPLVAVSGLCFCLYYRNTLGEKWYWLIPYLVSLVAIKNSGILFVLFLMAVVLYCLGKKGLGHWFVLGCFPGAALLLWQKHVLLVFSNGLNSRHAMSAQSITGNLLRKDGEALLEVLRVFLEAVLSWKNPVLILLGLVIVLTLLGRLLKLRWTEEGSQLLFFAGASYLIYEVFVLAMYLTTMPYGEAVALAGYSRYHRTILIFCGACVFLAVAEALPDNLAIQSPAFLLTVILMYQSLFPGLWYNNPKHCGFVREEFQQLVTQSEVAHGKSYCVVVEAEYARKYSGYLQYLIRYLLNSADMKVCSVEEYRQKESGWENYAYLICFGESEEMDAFLLEQFGSTEQRVALKD